MLSKLLHQLCSVLVCGIPLLAATSLAQTTINVGPGQPYTTIQSGINAASNGDTVLVAPGTYNESINFNGKAITVTSSGGPSVTTIDAGSRGGVATVIFNTGETSTSVISNFTIRGGGDTIFTGTSNGGVYVGGTSPTIQNNTITANYCNNIDVEFGVATILNNEISGVLQDFQGTQGEDYCTFPSAISLQGTDYLIGGLGSIVEGNTIEDNLTGPAINLWAAQYVLIQNNVIRKNTSPTPGSAVISANSFSTAIVQNLIYGNTSTCGGALALEEEGDNPATPGVLIANNTIVDNVTPDPMGASNCIAIAQIYPDPYSYGSSNPGQVIVNNIISGSTSYPAVNCGWYETPSEANQPTFQNNILHNAGGAFFGSFCIDVSNEYNNVTADPQFVSPSTGDYHLKSTSPAIDTGENSAVQQTYLAMTGQNLLTDFDGNPRIQNATGKGCIVDMGAYEYAGANTACSTTETLTSSANPSTSGQNVTFTAQLSSTSGAPTGDVQFTDGTAVLGTETISGTGASTFSTSQLTVGSHSITATYQPTGSFAAASAALTQVVQGEPSTTSLTCSPTSIPALNVALLTATVSSPGGTPTGAIAFTDNGVALATQNLLSDQATLSYTGSTVGTHTLTATYVPTGAFASSSASCTETVTAILTNSFLTVSPKTSTFGSPVTLTATVFPPTSHTPMPVNPTGTVTFYSGSASIGTGTLVNGVANLTLNTLSGPSNNLTCTYLGDSIYAASNCNIVPFAVNPAPATLLLNSSNNPAPALSPITFTVRLTTSGQSAGAGNTIALNLNGQTITLSTDATGSATYIDSALTPGSYPVTATFAATANLLASSASLTEVVSTVPTTTSLTVTPNPAYVGQAVTMVASVSTQLTSTPVNSTGSITFFDGTTALGTQPVGDSGTVTFITTALAIGTHAISATFNPSNTVFVASGSPVVNEDVLASGFTIALTPATITLARGTSGTVAIQLASVGNFTGPLSLTWGALPADATVSMNPTTVTLAPGGTGSSMMMLNTLLVSSSAPPVRPGSRGFPIVFAASTLLLFPLTLKRRRKLSSLIWIALLTFALQATIGCGYSKYTGIAVAAGTYQVPVIATDANQHTQTATLTVNVT